MRAKGTSSSSSSSVSCSRRQGCWPSRRGVGSGGVCIALTWGAPSSPSPSPAKGFGENSPREWNSEMTQAMASPRSMLPPYAPQPFRYGRNTAFHRRRPGPPAMKVCARKSHIHVGAGAIMVRVVEPCMYYVLYAGKDRSRMDITADLHDDTTVRAAYISWRFRTMRAARRSSFLLLRAFATTSQATSVLTFGKREYRSTLVVLIVPCLSVLQGLTDLTLSSSPARNATSPSSAGEFSDKERRTIDAASSLNRSSMHAARMRPMLDNY